MRSTVSDVLLGVALAALLLLLAGAIDFINVDGNLERLALVRGDLFILAMFVLPFIAVVAFQLNKYARHVKQDGPSDTIDDPPEGNSR